jgi:adenosine/AMP kinase
MNLLTVKVEKPEATNFVLGQSHFIKTVEDIHEAIVTTAPQMRFGLAFCESSGPALVRRSGNDGALTELAARNALAVGAGHSFFVFMENGFPVNVLNAIKAVPEVCRIFCATANAAEVVVAESGEGRAILGVVDGCSPKGVEGEQDVLARLRFLREIGYKLG